MRAVVFGLTASLLTGPAFAADILRGSSFEPAPQFYSWSGWYFGGQVGYANTDFGFSGATRDQVANAVRNLWVEEQFKVSSLPNLPDRDGRSVSYGGFVGYNAQWGDIVLGLEINYSHTDVSRTSSEVVGRAFTNTSASSVRNDVLITSNATARLLDYASIRGRAGYAMGWMMPYAMIGLAIGHGNYSRSVAVNIVESDTSTTPWTTTGTLNETVFDQRNNALTWGFTTGGGVDLGLTQNFFVRAEYEYTYLTKMGGIDFHINTIRGGAGYKF